jgi:hypothetical protein
MWAAHVCVSCSRVPAVRPAVTARSRGLFTAFAHCVVLCPALRGCCCHATGSLEAAWREWLLCWWCVDTHSTGMRMHGRVSVEDCI